MAVIVEVPDASTSRLAKRLLGRRSGVTVVVADPAAAPGGGLSAHTGPHSGADRRIIVGLPSNGDRRVSLLQQGVWAVVPATDDDVDRLLRGYVDDVRTGLCPLLNEISRDHGDVQELVEAVRRQPRTRAGRPAGKTETPLAERETEILQRIANGVTSREIAEEMGYQLQTVKNKVTAILTKTHARSRTHAVSIALTRGWIAAS